MTIEAAEKYLSSSPKPSEAFKKATSWHPILELSRGAPAMSHSDYLRLGQATSDIFTAGVAYFSNRANDSYLTEVGDTTWLAVNRQLAVATLTSDVRAAAIQLGAPPEIVLQTEFRPGEPYVFFAAKKEGIITKELAFILIPHLFLETVKDFPVEALAALAWISSQVRDLANGRLTIDQPNFNERGLATEAHFLIHALAVEPETRLKPFYHEVLRRYPKGLTSLPDKLKYQSGGRGRIQTG